MTCRPHWQYDDRVVFYSNRKGQEVRDEEDVGIDRFDVDWPSRRNGSGSGGRAGRGNGDLQGRNVLDGGDEERRLRWPQGSSDMVCRCSGQGCCTGAGCGARCSGQTRPDAGSCACSGTGCGACCQVWPGCGRECQDCGSRRRSRNGLGEYVEQGLPLHRDDLLRQDEGREVHVGGRCQGGWGSSGCWKALLKVSRRC